MEATEKPTAVAISKLLEIMARLRNPQGGCAWDLEQRFETIAPYTIEEAYEVDDAIRRGDLDGLRDELGDLLLQVVFHAQMAKELGAFSFDDVVAAICDKMVRRHPNVFGDAVIETARDQVAAWEESKARERGEGAGPLEGIPLGLPALLRAEKLQRRAARAGAKAPEAAAAAAGIEERLAELRAGAAPEEARDAVGELLFAAVALARSLDLEPEECLRGANARFEQLFASKRERR